MERSWFKLNNEAEIPSPALLIYVDRVEENVRRMIAMTGGVERLRPHVKTHKMPEIMRLQIARGIRKFKCATIAEAEMAASSEAPDILLAYQPAGPNAARLLALTKKFPTCRFSTVADDADTIRALAQTAAREGVTLDVMLDIDVGQHRTGVEAGPYADELYRLIAAQPGLRAAGLHAYDGHIHISDVAARTAAHEAAFAPVAAMRERLRAAGVAVPCVVAGGTPTFPMHARRGDVECSPGTCVLWDAGYGKNMPDLDFLPAAVLLTRVISKPAGSRLCLDLGHKAVASEMPHPRVVFPELPDAVAVAHNEEHLVLETPRAAEFAVGDCLYGIPWHICPTVALHSEAVAVEYDHAVRYWPVTARARRLSI